MKDLHSYLQGLIAYKLEEIALCASNYDKNEVSMEEVFKIARMIWYWETGKKLSDDIKPKRMAALVAIVVWSANLYRYILLGYCRMTSGK